MSQVFQMPEIDFSNARQFPVKGNMVDFYPVSVLAKALGRTTQTVRKWEKNNVIPKSAFKDKHGRRLYTKEQIEFVVRVALEEEIRQGESLANTNFSKRIFDGWKEVTKESVKGSK